MQPKLKLLLWTLLSVHFCYAQITIFSENIGSTSVNTSQPTARTFAGFQNYGVGNIQFDAPLGSVTQIRDNSTSSIDYTAASGGNFAYLTGNSSSYLAINNIRINGGSNLKLLFGMSKTTPDENGSNLQVSITVGTTTVNFVPTVASGTGTSGDWDYITSPVSIPTGTTMSLRFSNISTSTNSVSFRIDDIAIISDTPLPVTFGNVTAFRNNNAIKVKWTTESETNNSHFEIEASTDGENFKTVKTIKSTNGNADVKQNYEVSISASDIANLAFPAILCLLSVGLSRRKRLIGFAAATIMLAVNIAACSKTAGDINMDGIQKVFIRIKQVDTNGNFKYSKVIEVNSN